ncbi:MAG: hypothetical protein CMJ26_00005, partial [Phycisphaerae bacterium]|nr:hypothetical protein [Phycisphaerae bacterium]
DNQLKQVATSLMLQGFFALSSSGASCSLRDEQDLPFLSCWSTNGSALGAGCSTYLSAYLQFNSKTPRWRADASCGCYEYQGYTPDQNNYENSMAISNEVLNQRSSHADEDDGTKVLIETYAFSPGDAARKNNSNNATYGEWLDNNSVEDPQTGKPAIMELENLGYQLNQFSLSEQDGHFIIGSNAWQNKDGSWHYEYAIWNHSSHECAGSFSINLPSGATVGNVQFYAPEKKDAERYSDNPWNYEIANNKIIWSTLPFTGTLEDEFSGIFNEESNPLEWATLYNFSFDCNIEPASARGIANNAELIGYRPNNGGIGNIEIAVKGPAIASNCIGDLDGSGEVDVQDLLIMIGDWGECECESDFDSNGEVDVDDLLLLIGAWGVCP